MCQMAQLVHHYIVQDSGRRQHEPPVEGESSFGAAASPTGFLISDGDAVEGAAGKLEKVLHTLGEIFFCSINITAFQGGTLGVSQIRDGAVLLFFLHFQISGDNPDPFFDEQMADFFVCGAQGNPQRDLAIGRDADGTGFTVASDDSIGQLIEPALIFDSKYVVWIILSLVFHGNSSQPCQCGRFVLLQ